MKRRKLTKRGSKRLFRKFSGTHKKNLQPMPQRGGFRM